MTITIACTSCRKRLSLKDELAGKRVKCPACGQILPVVASAPPAAATMALATAAKTECPILDDVESNAGKGSRKDTGQAEVCTVLDSGDAGETPTSKRMRQPDDAEAAPDGDWGESVLAGQHVPENMQQEIRQVLQEGERITWATRARMDMLLANARILKIVGMVMVGIASALLLLSLAMLGLPVGLWLFSLVPAEGALGMGAIMVLVVVLVLLLIVITVGVAFIRLPRRMQDNEKTRSCYLIAGRRLIIHPGSGMDLPVPKWMKAIPNFFAKWFRKKSKVAIGVTPYGYADLTKLHRIETKKFPGAGDIVLGLNDLEQSALYRMVGIDNVQQAERTLREKVLHPAVDELLAGQRSVADLRRGLNETGKGDAAGLQSKTLPPERDVKDLMSASRMTANGKKFRSAIASTMDEVADDLRQKVQADLTEGEEVLWIDRPQGTVRGRGVLGALIGQTARKEPVYELYAITNRRALLWASKDTSVDAAADSHQFGNTGDMSMRGPLSYYLTDLTGVGLEEDERIEDGGSIIFKSVRVTITYTRDNGSRRLGGKSKTRRNEIHYFGILRIRNVHAVMRLLYDRLIASCR
jgi:hypothetical protein